MWTHQDGSKPKKILSKLRAVLDRVDTYLDIMLTSSTQFPHGFTPLNDSLLRTARDLPAASSPDLRSDRHLPNSGTPCFCPPGLCSIHCPLSVSGNGDSGHHVAGHGSA